MVAEFDYPAAVFLVSLSNFAMTHFRRKCIDLGGANSKLPRLTTPSSYPQRVCNSQPILCLKPSPTMTLSRVGPQGAPTHQLEIQQVFKRLSLREQLYAHHLSRAAWHGTRVILQQTSPEANGIFDLIIALHKSCHGRWNDWVADGTVTEQELSAFLDYAALFLSYIGNFFVSNQPCYSVAAVVCSSNLVRCR